MKNQYLSRDEIKSKLETQFSKIRENKNVWGREDAENLLKSEWDVCDNIEPNSSNYQFARELQDEFLCCEDFNLDGDTLTED